MIDKPHIIHDIGGKFITAKVKDKFTNIAIITYKIPSARRACFIFCNNIFYYDIKQ